MSWTRYTFLNVHILKICLYRYIPTDCSKIIVKVSDKECQKYYKNDNGGRDYDDNGNPVQYPDLGNKEDCFTNVNWTWGINNYSVLSGLLNYFEVFAPPWSLNHFLRKNSPWLLNIFSMVTIFHLFNRSSLILRLPNILSK